MALPAVRVVTFLACEHRPADAGVLVGDGDEALVIADAVAQSHDPVLEVRALVGCFAQCGIQCGTRPLSEQGAQVRIAALSDLAEPILAAGAGLLGHQPDPGGHLPPGAEVAGIADACHYGTGGDWTDAIEVAQSL